MPQDAPRIGTEMQDILVRSARSPMRTYQDLFIGNRSLADTIRYELVMHLCQRTPGALGLWLRRHLYPLLLKSARGVTFGAGVTLRHPRKISIGPGTVIDDGVVLDAKGGGDSHITIGRNCFIGRGTILSCKGGSIEIGENANLGAYCQIQAESPVVIGRDFLAASYVYIVAGGNHDFLRLDIPINRQRLIRKGGIRIGDDCWLAARVVVLDGAHIGNGCVVGACATVTRPLPEYSVAMGTPAKVRANRKGPMD